MEQTSHQRVLCAEPGGGGSGGWCHQATWLAIPEELVLEANAGLNGQFEVANHTIEK